MLLNSDNKYCHHWGPLNTTIHAFAFASFCASCFWKPVHFNGLPKCVGNAQSTERKLRLNFHCTKVHGTAVPCTLVQWKFKRSFLSVLCAFPTHFGSPLKWTGFQKHDAQKLANANACIVVLSGPQWWQYLLSEFSNTGKCDYKCTKA